MKAIIRISISLLIVLLLLCGFAVGVLAAAQDENTTAEEIAADEENGLEKIQLIWIAIAPSVGAVTAAAVVGYRVIKQFKDLRADVIEDGQIAAIKKENKKLQNMIEQLVRFQENDFRDREGLKKSIKSMEQTAQKLELHMCRIEAKYGGTGDDAEV